MASFQQKTDPVNIGNSSSSGPNIHRRSSVSTAPYSIPAKTSHNSETYQRKGGPVHTHHHHHHHSHGNSQGQHLHSNNSNNSSGQLSSSVPLLSREFVVRRISEGETGRLKEELKCEACGKGYKHISSLAKHLWEHTPEWNVTKKLLISKHQQVQLLEAASILCSMTDKEEKEKEKEKERERELPGFKASYLESGFPSITSPPSSLPSSVPSKLRTNSISQYPPSSSAYKENMPKPVTQGGYLDTNRQKIKEEKVNEEDPISNRADDLHTGTPRFVSKDPSSSPVDENDNDDSIFGAME
ncbi:Hypothetical protein PP7435_CHR4-0097 [Komagataella phaffii CBS 7435]|uniref:C2H2-type domain-containing protein n=2 Tax=Komagataella phaffii TaxID=460519 RepID=C4R948_KOMPG|nr:Hypothetical protein PAS_chr4_0855 [Komagataella phaffii GS115]AOA64924.1 GQ67_05247T0 [Komagataella phaffii]CAH2450466.1 Hypothetical protein BQ9382_C4-0530 [Komagataella phaffii CBS 7435]AOA70205.1 GQ68_05229T0 [Komagataella phaffii GS115]CAY72123.1 Hypothetical protein PAS_chr4_0855 [Komagataella phaffii GS115]CCA40273.1 Hypothetical protein PP7435_CHR4-0097 [Komagataella phaffii CBS 7435]